MSVGFKELNSRALYMKQGANATSSLNHQLQRPPIAARRIS